MASPITTLLRHHSRPHLWGWQQGPTLLDPPACRYMLYSKIIFIFSLDVPVSFLAIHSKTTKYGMKTQSEHLANSSHVQTHNMWFVLVSFLCFGVPFIHRRHINLAQRNSELRGDEKTWPTYIEGLVREWSTFNLAVRTLYCISPHHILHNRLNRPPSCYRRCFHLTCMKWYLIQ